MKINNNLLLNFKAFVINKNLPKYKLLTKSEKDITTVGGSIGETEGQSIPLSPRLSDESELYKSYEGLTVGKLEDYISKADARDFNICISKTLLDDMSQYKYSQTNTSNFDGTEKEESEDDTITLDVTDIFDQVHLEIGKERKFIDRVRTYCELINKAHEMGQTAQEDRLIRGLWIHIYESVLAVSGFGKYIEISQLQELQRKCIRLLDLDYIANFTRIIPPEVAEKKLYADKLHVFDNYMVLHYDPTGATRELTEEEKRREIERKTDPVLFGVIQGSTKLYYIGDWVDEYCDLTWEQIVEKIGEKSV